MKPQKQQIKIHIDEKIGEGIYANMALITHSPSEVVIDFLRMLPGMAKTNVQARIIMTPQHAKQLHLALGDNLKKYEEQFGEIKIMQKEQERNFGFRPPTED